MIYFSYGDKKWKAAGNCPKIITYTIQNREISGAYNFWTPAKNNIPDVWNWNCWTLFSSEIDVGRPWPPAPPSPEIPLPPIVATPLIILNFSSYVLSPERITVRSFGLDQHVSYKVDNNYIYIEFDVFYQNLFQDNSHEKHCNIKTPYKYQKYEGKSKYYSIKTA